MYYQRKKALFDHIPKTGGMTIHKILEDFVGNDLSPILNSSFKEGFQLLNQYKIVSGHFYFYPDDLKKNFLDDLFLFTLLRDPLDRIISHFFYSKEDTANTGNFVIEAAKTYSLYEYVFSENINIRNNISNVQVNHFYPSIWNGSNDLSENEKLDLAKKSFDYYDLVGVYHQFDDFLTVLCYECGWPPVREIPRINVTSKRPKISEIDPKIIQRLEELNQLDLALYEYATQLFNQKKRQTLHECIEQRYQELNACSTYLAPSKPQTPPSVAEGGIASPPSASPQKGEERSSSAPAPIDFGNRQLEIINVNVKGAVSLTNTLFSGEEIAIRVVFRAHIDVENLTVGIHIHDRFGRLAFGTNSECLGYTLHVHANGIYFVDYRFRNDLGIGVYTVGAALHIGSSHLSSCFHWRDEVTRFEVVGNIGYHFEGAAKIYPQLRCGILSSNPADIQILPAAQDWPRLQQIAIHTPKLTEFRAQICLLQTLEQLRPNEVIAIEAEITNTSGQTWGSIGQSPVHLSYHWQNLSGEWLEFDGLRTPLPYDIAPGETFRHYLTIKSPSQSGDALLQPTLVQEGVAWFDKQGYPPLEIRVRIGE